MSFKVVVLPKSRAIPTRFDGDTGTSEIKKQFPIAIEARSRTSTGQATTVGARVIAQFPIDRYRARGELDRDREINDILWGASERLRNDFQIANIAGKLCSSFEPRIKSGKPEMGNHQVEALMRYKKAMNSVSQRLQRLIFFVCIEGWSAGDWAVKNQKPRESGLALLQVGLADLADFYGMKKKKRY